MNGSTQKNPVPVAKDLFEGGGLETRLLGSRCDGCGRHYFPQTLSCRNPGCVDKRVSPASLSRHGSLYSYTVQAYRPPPLFKMDNWKPYAIGMVELPEGLRVMGMLTGVEPDQIRIGMPLQVTTGRLHTDELGRDVTTYQFMPLTGAEAPA